MEHLTVLRNIWKTYCSILLKKHENINIYDQDIIKFFIGDYVKHIFSDNMIYYGFITNIINNNIEVTFEDGEIISDMKSIELIKVKQSNIIKPTISIINMNHTQYNNSDEFYQATNGLSKKNFYQSIQNLPEKRTTFNTDLSYLKLKNNSLSKLRFLKYNILFFKSLFSNICHESNILFK